MPAKVCSSCGNTNIPQSPHVAEIARAPSIGLDALDLVPFSESCSGLFEGNGDDDTYDFCNDLTDDHDRTTNANECSYLVEQFSDVMDLDPDWDDDDIAEVMVLSHNLKHWPTRLPTIAEELDTPSFIASSGSDHTRHTQPCATLADFEIIATSEYPKKCRRRSGSKFYVIKSLASGMLAEKLVMESIREIDSPFLDRLRWTFSVPGDCTYLVLDFHSEVTVATIVQDNPLNTVEAMFFACELVEGIGSLHLANIAHRDITPANVLIDRTGHVVLSDFSNAVFLSGSPPCHDCPPLSSAVEFQAPEITWTHNLAVDCWSFGLLLHFMLTGRNPVVDHNLALPIRSQVLDGHPKIQEALPFEATDLIIKCLERNPIFRLSITKIRDHSYFFNTDWEDVRAKRIPLPGRDLTPSPKVRPTSQDFPLPPDSRFSNYFDTSLDNSFTVHTAIKAVPVQPRLKRVESLCEEPRRMLRPFLRSTCSMDDIYNRNKARRTSLSGVRGPRTMQEPRSASAVGSLGLQVLSPDSLPKIFKCTPLDHSLVREQSSPGSSPASSHSSPTMCELSPRERMEQFWARLDAEELRVSSTSVPQQHSHSLEFRDALRLALPSPALHRRIRKPLSAASGKRTSVLSANKLRKLKRPLSSPVLSSPSSNSDPVPNLPAGLEQIGQGIGFTYKLPAASRSKASICSNGAQTHSGKVLRRGLKSLLHRARSFSYSRQRSLPAPIKTGGHLAVEPSLASPLYDSAPSTPDSISFPLLPEIVDPFAKASFGEGVPSSQYHPTLRLVSVTSTDLQIPSSLDHQLISGWEALDSTHSM